MTRTVHLPPDAAGRRLDVVVGEVLGLSRARVKSLFEAGAVRVDGRRPKKGDRATGGARVEVELLEEAPSLVPEPGLAIRLLYEDRWLLAVDKPAGMPSHPLRPGEMGTAANALVGRFPEVAKAGDEVREGGLVHRLDIDTSGVLLAARDTSTWQAVRKLFRERAVDKRYWALVSGPIGDSGAIDLPLRHKGDTGVEPALDGGEEGREALSEFRVLGRSGELALVEVRILTGVLHQVRAHLAAIGAPVVGDTLYGGRPFAGLPRFFLHARSVELMHPATGVTLHVGSPLPEQLRQALTAANLRPPDAAAGGASEGLPY
ncbi:MAG: RluA family pseudouridine synthase [Myxococcaceae bacterium]